MRASPMRRSTKPMKRIGKRLRAWNTARAKLKAGCVLAGITRCEFGYDGCYGGNALTFAHAVKRRYITADAPVGSPVHIETVAVACLRCHTRLDFEMNHGQMLTAVMTAIASRETGSVSDGESE